MKRERVNLHGANTNAFSSSSLLLSFTNKKIMWCVRMDPSVRLRNLQSRSNEQRQGECEWTRQIAHSSMRVSSAMSLIYIQIRRLVRIKSSSILNYLGPLIGPNSAYTTDFSFHISFAFSVQYMDSQSTLCVFVGWMLFFVSLNALLYKVFEFSCWQR